MMIKIQDIFAKLNKKNHWTCLLFLMKGVWKSTVSGFKCKKSLSNYYSVRVIIVELFKIKL